MNESMKGKVIDSRFHLTLELHDEGGHGWHSNNYHEIFDVNPDHVKDNVERISVHEVSQEEFVERYEKIYKPVVITGVIDNWKGKHKWTLSVSE
jgi:histone arginine demethylase JMJD6